MIRRNVIWSRIVFVAACATLLAVSYVHRRGTVDERARATTNHRHGDYCDDVVTLGFVPRPFSGDCNDLFTGRALPNFSMSAYYR